MSYRVCRKTTSKTFKVNNHVCKVFLEPIQEVLPGFWSWNVGFAVGRSKRQINDWYRNKKNRRARSLQNKLIGKAGLKTIATAFDHLLVLRWNIRPGDVMLLDCTSGRPEQQFRAWQRWRKNHQDAFINEETKEFWWYRPPYPGDEVYKHFKVIPLTPLDKRMSWAGEGYFLCFDAVPKDPHKQLPTEQTAQQASLVPRS